MQITKAMQRLLGGSDLSQEETLEVMDEVMTGEATPAQIGGFLMALRMKGETAEEVAGAAQAMRSHAVAVKPAREDVIDTAGTGGDGKQTLNISTAAALVAAGAGAGVAKHGNRAISSLSGSADVLEELGFRIEMPPGRIAESIDTLGFGFMFAPAHHPAMKHAMPVRRELGVRTVFNILGPLTNPAGAKRQLVGVYSPDVAEIMAEVLALLGAVRAMVVHGAGGIDELSPAGPNLVYAVEEGEVRRRTVDPADLGMARCQPSDLNGGPPEANAAAIRRIFEGQPSPRADAVLLNAAASLRMAGIGVDLREGLALATEAVTSGEAGRRLEVLAAFTQAEEALA